MFKQNLKRMIANMVFVWAMAQLTQRAECLNENNRLSLPATGPNIRFNRIRSLGVNQGAQLSLFDSAKTFPHLEGVGLNFSGANREYLQKLATNYSGLKRLDISQQTPVDDESVFCIHAFTQLKQLSLDCPIESYQILVSSLSPSLKRLNLWHQSDLLSVAKSHEIKLPGLETLDIRGVTIPAKFLDSFEAPKLRKLMIANCSMGDSVGELSKFPELRVVEIYNCPTAAGAVKEFEQHKIKVNNRPASSSELSR